jgi:hypothetical protein
VKKKRQPAGWRFCLLKWPMNISSGRVQKPRSVRAVNHDIEWALP